MEELIKRSKIDYYFSMGVIAFSVITIGVAPVFVENYFWQVMLIPIIATLPNFLLARRFLIEHKAI